MSSILDIDLDYFNLIENPEQRLKEILDWGNHRITFVVEKHHKAYSRWKDRVKRGTLTPPSHILHADEHHDMMDQKRYLNIANFMYHAMRTWRNCRVPLTLTETDPQLLIKIDPPGCKRDLCSPI